MSVYAVPPGAHFAEAFARGLLERQAAQPVEAMARIRLLVNTRRSLRVIEDALTEAAPPPLLLPRLSLLSELGADPLAEPDLTPAIDPFRRRLRLIRLVEHWLQATEGGAARVAAPDLAAALEGLLDELDEEGIDAARLDGLVPDGLATHWQRTLRFADLVRDVWPAIRAEEEGGALDPKARQRAVIERLVARWRDAPPADPVIAAASTGSVASTAELLAAVARLPDGMVVLPGFDRSLPDDIWDCLSSGQSPDHPMAPFVRLLAALELRPGDVRPWGTREATSPRARLMTQALRPAPVTDAWIAATPALAPETEAATGGLILVEAQNQRLEAGAVAISIRRGLQRPGCRIALVTPDATLARRVTAELARFGIVPDDSLGKPLAQSPAAVFFRLVARAAGPEASPVTLAALLQHPLCQPGCPRDEHLKFARRYELTVLRAKPQLDRPSGALPVWEKANADQAAWLRAIQTACAPLGQVLSGGTLSDILAAHLVAAEALSRPGPDQASTVWQKADGEALRRFLGRLAASADALGPGPVADWPGLLASLIEGEQLRPDPAQPHPRVAIWGTMEARVQAADLIILGGLNEGTWPGLPSPDPWLSRPMRAALGLTLPEAAIGLSAHDFLQGVLKPEVVMTRANRIDGTPSVPSRWLLRLGNLLDGLGRGALAAMRDRGDALIRLAERLHRPDRAQDPASRPGPKPPAHARPRRLSATQVERLIRDAYAIYAQTVLKLDPLDPLGRPANFLDRGIVIHAILERFVDQTRDRLPSHDAARDLLLKIAADVLAAEVPWPDVRRIWLGRIARFAEWFLAGERARRRTGRPGMLEAKGEMELTIGGQPFRLTARADRIDTLNDGEAAIFDYKAGQPPKEDQIKAGFAHQLALQAAILTRGGFAGLPPLETDRGAYIGLTGSGAGGLETKSADLTAGRADYLDRLVTLLERYAQPSTPYLSRSMIERLDQDGDYDHLARRWEWEGA